MLANVGQLPISVNVYRMSANFCQMLADVCQTSPMLDYLHICWYFDIEKVSVENQMSWATWPHFLFSVEKLLNFYEILISAMFKFQFKFRRASVLRGPCRGWRRGCREGSPSRLRSARCAELWPGLGEWRPGGRVAFTFFRGTNFGGLALDCIEADFCEQLLVL